MFRQRTTKKTHRKYKPNTPKSFREEDQDIDFATIWETISQLEHYLIEDHRQDYKLRMTFDRQAERVLDLQACLNNEQQRNKRLVKLILAGDSWPQLEKKEDGSENVTTKSYESISPLLMQQRYEDLSCSFNVCRQQLFKRDNELKVYKCERELQQSKYESLLQTYKQEQKRLERLGKHCLQLEKVKNYKIHYLKEALTYATNCLIAAQQFLDTFVPNAEPMFALLRQDFQQNLQLFLNTLVLTEWRYCNCHIISDN